MQETKEKLSLNISSVDGVVSRHPVMIPRGLIAPYQQQVHDINNMLQNHMTRELYNQFNLLEQRAVSCVQAKNKALEEVMRKTREMEFSLSTAKAEVEYWKKLSDQKSVLCKDLAERLLKARKRQNSRKMNVGVSFAEEAESSTGENGDHGGLVAARSRSCKRRRL